MSNFYLLSEGGDGLGLAIRLKAEGHSVSMTIKDSKLEDRGENLIEKSKLSGFNPIIICDCTGSGAILDAFRDAGAYTFGGSQIADRLECDRGFASQIFSECGIQEPLSKSYNNWEEAESDVNANSGYRLVFKPEGSWSGNLPSYVSKDNEDLLSFMSGAKAKIGEAEPSYVLQEFIEGTCISSEAWIAQGEIVPGSLNHTLERKEFLNGNYGPSGGCTGNVVWKCEDYSCQLCAQLYKIREFLATHLYTGPIDINTVVSKTGEIYALEFTPRFGYDAFPTLLYGLFDGSFGSFLDECSKGSRSGNMPLRSGFAAGVRISCPPWPNEDYKSKANLPLRGLSERSLEKFYTYEVSRREDEFVTSGGVGIIGVAIGYSESSIEEAFDDAYKICEKIKLQDKQFRTDFREEFKSDLRKLKHSMGVTYAS